MPWTWLVTYTDDTVLAEVDEAGREHGFGEVDLSRVRAVALLPLREGLPCHVVAVDPSRGQRPIFFRRHQIEVALEDGVETGRRVVTVLGWQRTVRGVNVKSLAFYFDDGSSLVTDDDLAV